MLNVHVTHQAEYEAKGYVVIDRPHPERVEMTHPNDTCLHPLRGGVQCLMEKGHKGRHSSSVFNCDICGKYRRGTPAAVDSEAGIGQCWFCLNILHPSPYNTWAAGR